jgi:hypothetical protein
MSTRDNTSPTSSPDSFGLGVAVGRLEAKTDFTHQQLTGLARGQDLLIQLTRRALEGTTAPSSTAAAPTRRRNATATPPQPSRLQKLLHKLSGEFLLMALGAVAKWALHYVIPATLIAWSAMAGFGSTLAKWLGRLVGAGW